MVNPWRLLLFAAVVNVLPAVAAAQTVMVRNAPPKSTIELVVNTETVGSATADENGHASITATMFATSGKRETDANLYVDVCPDRRRVVLVERGEVAQNQDVACSRTESLGLFLVRPISTLVVNLSTAIPTVMLRQGPVSFEPRPGRTPVPTGFIVFGGAGMAKFRDQILLACGNVSSCSGDEWGIAYTAGAEYWISRFLSAELAYGQRADLEIAGSGDTFRFDSVVESQLTTITGKFGVPMGPVRLYAKGGANYLRASTGTTQTVDDTTVIIDGVEQTVEGGTVRSQIDFSGWGWTFGGGLEAWIRPSFGIYAEFGISGLKGSPRSDVEGTLDDRVTHAVGGIRIRIGG